MNILKICKDRFSLEKEYLGTNKPVNKISPVVSVCIATFQHAGFIKDCLEGALMQKTDFDFEIIIGEDESNDGTRQICIEYAEKYPDKIRLFLRNRKTSQLYDSNGNFVCRFNGKWNRVSARGKYIALCEGDDYWTDPLKLQKQVDFLEAHPEYSICVGGYSKLDNKSGKIEDIVDAPLDSNMDSNGYEFSLVYDPKKKWKTQTMTIVFRNLKAITYRLLDYNYARDTHLFYHALKEGKGFYLTQVLGVYRISEVGVWSLKTKYFKIKHEYDIFKELHIINSDDWSRKMRHNATIKLLSLLVNNKQEKNIKISKAKLFFELLSLNKNLEELKKTFATVVPNKLKKLNNE